jgi:hypothetical protein
MCVYLFTCRLCKCAVSNSDWVASNERMRVRNELERTRKEATLSNFKICDIRSHS